MEVGPGDASVSVDWSKHVWSGWEVKVGGSVGFGGMKGFLTWARKITELIKLTMSVEGAFSSNPSSLNLQARCPDVRLVPRTQPSWPPVLLSSCGSTV